MPAVRSSAAGKELIIDGGIRLMAEGDNGYQRCSCTILQYVDHSERRLKNQNYQLISVVGFTPRAWRPGSLSKFKVSSVNSDVLTLSNFLKTLTLPNFCLTFV